MPNPPQSKTAPQTAPPPPPSRLADAAWLHAPATQAVFAALEADGARARCVGGALRNALMGRPVSDIDIATPSPPEEVMALAAKAGLKTIATGLQHGTVTIVSGGVPHEVTTLRRDVETDGRHAKVAFTDDWALDAARRDFTMNALYCDADGTIFDPLGGYGDLVARRVRFIGQARERIEEDYLRILRFFRFNAQYGDPASLDLASLDAAGVHAAIQGRGGLARLSAERIHMELHKTLAAPAAINVVAVMHETGFLPLLLGVAPQLSNLSRLTAIEAAQGLAPDPGLRLSALTIAVAEDVPRLTERLRLSNAEAAKLAAGDFSAQNADDFTPGIEARDELRAKRLLYRLGETAYRQRLLLAWARAMASPNDPSWASLYSLPQRWTPPVLPLTGADIIARGIAPGPIVGEILRRFETWWLMAGFPKDDAIIEEQVAALLAAAPLS